MGSGVYGRARPVTQAGADTSVDCVTPYRHRRRGASMREPSQLSRRRHGCHGAGRLSRRRAAASREPGLWNGRAGVPSRGRRHRGHPSIHPPTRPTNHPRADGPYGTPVLRRCAPLRAGFRRSVSYNFALNFSVGSRNNFWPVGWWCKGGAPSEHVQRGAVGIVPYPAFELPGTARVPSSRWLDASSTKGDTWDSGKQIP